MASRPCEASATPSLPGFAAISTVSGHNGVAVSKKSNGAPHTIMTPTSIRNLVSGACLGTALLAPSAYLMKSPPQQWSDEVAHTRLETFISGTE